ncbi:MAG: AMP-binding protein [Rhodobacteraceae bacterium]|nr:AMP-binding protein [Paracoccaceae bacterium]
MATMRLELPVLILEVPMREFWDFDGLPEESCALYGPDGETVSYGFLSRSANDWAGSLHQLTSNRRCLVALELVAEPASVAAYLGALRAGYPVLVLEPGQIALEGSLMAAWNPEISIAAGATLPLLRRAPETSTPEPHPDLRVLLSTSGSTGDPKLVRLSARNMAANARSIAEYLCLTPADRAATTLPLHYSYGLSVLNSYLAAGASLALLHQSVIEPDFWAMARKAGVTSLAFVPHQMELLAHGGFAGSELPSLRYMTQAGGKLAPDLVRRFHAMARQNGWDLFIMYGQTEAAPRIAYVPPDALPEAAGTIGCAIPGGRIWLAAEDGTEVLGPGQPGELVYEGPNVMMGYATTRADFQLGQGVTRLHTGDVAERTDAGFFRIVGRMKRFVKLYGLRISLDQIEAFLVNRGVSAHAVAVDDTLVILHQDPERLADLPATLADTYGLPPSAFHVAHIAEVPRLSSGKPDQVALRRIAVDRLQTRSQRPGGQTLAEVLKQATRSDQVNPEDSFNTLGGDSLSYLQMQLALEERLGQAPQGWETMRLAELEAMVQDSTVVGTAHVRIGVDALLRLLAITLVVAQHATDYPLYGGTWMLIALMGYSMARFQVQQIAAGQPFRFVARLLYPIVPLYFILLLGYAMFRDSVPWSYWLLLGNYKVWQTGSLLEVYWFVSVYAQIVVMLALIASLPSLRTALLQSRWEMAALAASATVLGLAGLALLQTKFDLPYQPQRGLFECLSVFLIGWMLQSWQGRSQMLATGVLSVMVLGLLSQIDMSAMIATVLVGAFFLLGLNLTVRVPVALGRMLTLLVSVTLFVYLLHEIVIFVLIKAELPQVVVAGFALIISFTLAICVHRAFEILETWIPVSRSWQQQFLR